MDMELRLYGKILWRRIWVIVLVVGIMGIYVGYQYYATHKAPGRSLIYHSETNVRIGLQNLPAGSNQTFTDYITTSETLADEFTTGPTLTSTSFGQQIIQQIRNDMPTIATRYPHADLGDWTNPSTVTGALSATHTHSVVTIQVNWPTEAGAWAIARAVGEVCRNHIADYLSYKVDNQTTVNADYPIPAASVINVEKIL
jgi:capsular polysaccharide biosynthesis protein